MGVAKQEMCVALRQQAVAKYGAASKVVWQNTKLKGYGISGSISHRKSGKGS
jgi:hypothetical protein